MLNKQGFDLWADGYDKTVQVSEEKDSYPFAGYKSVLGAIFSEVMKKKDQDRSLFNAERSEEGLQSASILDIGIGTGVLTTKLYEHGYKVDGLDFSPNMISIAKAKMPDANLVEWDISKGLPDSIKENKYDFIISTYTLHHFSDHDKVILLKSLLSILNDEGKILIGDISFPTRGELETCRNHNKDHWDEDEFYFVFEEIRTKLEEFCSCGYQSISCCGGVIEITKI